MIYAPQVGHKVRRPEWGPGDTATVTAVGGDYFLAKFRGGNEHPYSLNGAWEHVTNHPPLPPMPDRWARVYEGHAANPSYATEAEASEPQRGAHIAVVKYVPDLDSVVWLDGVQS